MASEDDPESSAHHILDCLHPAKKNCGDRCWYYWYKNSPSPASRNYTSPSAVEIAGLNQKEVRLKAKQERQAKLRYESEDINSSTDTLSKKSNQDGRTVRQNWRLPPDDKTTAPKNTEAQLDEIDDMDTITSIINLLNSSSSMDASTILTPEAPPSTPTHTFIDHALDLTPKESVSPGFSIADQDSPLATKKKSQSFSAEVNSNLSPPRTPKRKHSKDAAGETPKKGFSSSSSFSSYSSSSTTVVKATTPSSTSNLEETRTTTMADDVVDNITMEDAVDAMDDVTLRTTPTTLKRKHSHDAALDTPNKRSSAERHNEDATTSVLASTQGDTMTLTNAPSTPTPTSKRRHSHEAALETPNKKQALSPMNSTHISSIMTPDSTTKLTTKMTSRIESVTVQRRLHLTFPSQSMPPEVAPNLCSTHSETPTKRRASAMASMSILSAQPTSAASALSPSTPTPVTKQVRKLLLTPQTEKKDDTPTADPQSPMPQRAKEAEFNIFDMIIHNLKPKDAAMATPSAASPGDAYPTPAKEPSTSTTSPMEDGETPVQRKLFPAASPSSPAPFEDFPTSTQNVNRPQTPTSRATSGTSSTGRAGTLRVTFADVPIVIDGTEPPSVIRKRRSTSTLGDVSPAQDTSSKANGTESQSTKATQDEKTRQTAEDAHKDVATAGPPPAPASDVQKLQRKGKKPEAKKALEIVDLISDDEDDALPELSTIIGTQQPAETPGAPKRHDKLADPRDKKATSKDKPQHRSVVGIWKRAALKSATKTSPKASETLLAVQEARGVKTIRVTPSNTAAKSAVAPSMDDGTNLIDRLQASGAIAHPTVDICGREIELQMLYDLVNHKYGGYTKVEDCDFWGRIATGLNLHIHDGSASEVRRVYRETLLDVGKTAEKAISLPDETPFVDLEAIRKEVEKDGNVEIETDLSEEKAIFMSKLGAQAIEPVQDICGQSIDLFLLSIVVEKNGGFHWVDENHLWRPIARTLLFGKELEDEAAEELQRVYTEDLLHLDEDLSSQQPVELVTKAGKKVPKPKKPDVIFDSQAFQKFMDAVKYVCQHSGQDFEDSIDICGKEVHIFDIWAVVKHKLGGYQKVVVYDKWPRAATLLGFNLAKKSQCTAAKEIQKIWDRLLRNVYIDIAPKYSRPEGKPRSGKDGTLRFSTLETRMLEDAFRVEGRLPGKEVREALARDMNVTRESINNWFYTRSWKANVAKRAREQAQAAKQVADGAKVIDLDPSPQDSPFSREIGRRNTSVDKTHFCEVERCGRPRIDAKYQGVESAKEYLGGVVGELIAVSEDGGHIVEEGADELDLQSPTRKGAVPGVGTAYRMRVKHSCGLPDDEDDNWGVKEDEDEDEDQAYGSESETVDAWEVPKPYRFEGIENFVGLDARDFEDDEENEDKNWDHEMVVKPFKNKSAEEIRARIDEQFGAFSFSRKSSESTEREDKVSPYGMTREKWPGGVLESIEDDLGSSNRDMRHSENVEIIEPVEDAGNTAVSPAQESLFVEQSPAPDVPAPFVASMVDMGQASYPQMSRIRYARSKDGKPFWPTHAQQKRLSVSELTELVSSRRSSSKVQQELEAEVHHSMESQGEAVEVASECKADVQMRDMPEIVGDLADIGESILKRQKEREAADDDSLFPTDVGELSSAAQKVVASIETVVRSSPRPSIAAPDNNGSTPDDQEPAPPKNVVRASDFVTYHNGKAVVDETAAWDAFDKDLLTPKEFGALTTVEKGDMSIELFEINCALFAGEVDDDGFHKLKEFFVGDCSLSELEEVLKKSEDGDGATKVARRTGEMEKPVLKALMNRARYCMSEKGTCDDVKLDICRMW